MNDILNKLQQGEITFTQARELANKLEQKEPSKIKIVRTYSAGVFYGEVESSNGQEYVLRNATRVWQWAGAASLSQLAMEGTKDPANCKFPCKVDRVELKQVIEVLDITDAALASLEAVKVWAK